MPGDQALLKSYLHSLEIELQAASGQFFTPDCEVASVFFGGGTPSLLAPEQVEKVIGRIGSLWPLAADVEITLECNPENLTDQWAAGCRSAGVTRLSVGCQSFEPKALAALGRRHSVEANHRAVEAARRIGFERISTDLIFGYPGSDKDSILRSVETAINLGVEHLALYGYHLEEGASGFGSPEFAPAGDDNYCEQYLAACMAIAGSGWLHYEISNWAKDEAAICRNNMLYWKRGAYLGCGPSAHSFLPPELRVWNQPDLHRYLEAAGKDILAIRESERLSPGQIRFEKVMLGLRLAEGVDRELIRSFHGQQTGRILEGLVESGLVRSAVDSRVVLTDKGFLLHDSVVEQLTVTERFELDKKN